MKNARVQLLVLLALSIAILAITFALQNPGQITLKFLLWEMTGSLAMILMMSFFLGFVASVFVAMATYIGTKLSPKKSASSRPSE